MFLSLILEKACSDDKLSGMKKNEARKQEEQEEITFPYTYSKPGHSVSVKIYKTPRDGYDAFTLAYYQDGTRVATGAARDRDRSDTTACIFWLKNRNPKEWRNRTELQTDQEIVRVPNEIVEELSKRFTKWVTFDSRNGNGGE